MTITKIKNQIWQPKTKFTKNRSRSKKKNKKKKRKFHRRGRRMKKGSKLRGKSDSKRLVSSKWTRKNKVKRGWKKRRKRKPF